MDFSHNVNDIDQVELVIRTAKKCETSFKKIVLIYKVKIKFIALKYAATLNEEYEDISQDIFMNIYIAAKKFKGESSVNTWIFAIAKNTINNKLRKKKLISFLQFWKINDLQVENEIKDFNDPESVFIGNEQVKSLVHRIGNLDKKHQQVFSMYSEQGLSYEQIAERMKINVGTVKSRISSVRKKLNLSKN